jgi:hypothetical protein
MTTYNTLIREKKNILLNHVNAEQDSDVEYGYDFLFYHHDTDKTDKYLIFTTDELKKYLFDGFKKSHKNEYYNFKRVEEVTKQNIETIETFFLPHIMSDDEGIKKGTYHLPDDKTKNIYSASGLLVNQFIQGKMTEDEFIKNYVQFLIDEELAYEEMLSWENCTIGDFHLFFIE